MGFLMTGGIMIATIAYLWKRRRKTEGGKTAVLLFALVFLYPIIAGGSLEKIWLGYLATLPAAVRTNSVPHVRQLRTPNASWSAA